MSEGQPKQKLLGVMGISQRALGCRAYKANSKVFSQKVNRSKGQNGNTRRAVGCKTGKASGDTI